MNGVVDCYFDFGNCCGIGYVFVDVVCYILVNVLVFVDGGLWGGFLVVKCFDFIEDYFKLWIFDMFEMECNWIYVCDLCSFIDGVFGS